MRDLVFALGALLAFEGLALALSPRMLGSVLERLRAEPEDRLRALGLIMAVVGVLILWIGR